MSAPNAACAEVSARANERAKVFMKFSLARESKASMLRSKVNETGRWRALRACSARHASRNLLGEEPQRIGHAPGCSEVSPAARGRRDDSQPEGKLLYHRT